MNLIDVNVLVYAFRKDAERHEEYRSWLLDLMNGESAFAVCDQVLSSVIRVTTHPRIFIEPSTLKEAIGFADSVRQQPTCRLVHPADNHWTLFTRLLEVSRAKANLVTDAWYAALAIESGCVWVTTDRDFSRFPGLKWQHPLDHTDTIQNPA